MASKAERNAVFALALAQGSLEDLVESYGNNPPKTVRTLTERALKRVTAGLDTYNATLSKKQLAKIRIRDEAVKGYMDNGTMPAPVVTSLVGAVLSDTRDEIREALEASKRPSERMRTRKKLFDDLIWSFRSLHRLYDKTMDQHDVYEDADRLAAEYYAREI